MFFTKGGGFLILRWALFLGFLVSAFGSRLYFGLHSPPAIIGDDEIQVYLIGLKSYCTHTWPYFGTDMQEGTYQGQMAGALLGLLVSVPLWIWPCSVSPYLFLNLLTFSAFYFFGWDFLQRLPSFPAWV